MDGKNGTTHIYINPIQADRADEWESFTRSVIAPAVSSQRPDVVDRVRLLRADGQTDGGTVFAFIFEGGDIADFDLEPVFVAEFGEEAGRQRLQEWLGMFAREQHGWTFREVSLSD